MGKQIIFFAKLPFTIKKKKDWYLIGCPILDVYTQGKTKKEAKNNLKDALSLFFVTCFEQGTLDQVMKECGFVGGKIEQKIPKIQPKNLINIPIPLQWDKTKQVACLA